MACLMSRPSSFAKFVVALALVLGLIAALARSFLQNPSMTQAEAPAAAGPYGLEARFSTKPFLSMPPRRKPATGWQVVDAFPNLRFQDPLMLLAPPMGNRLYVIGREGTVESFYNDPAVATKTMILDLRSQCQGWDDSGLLGMAFHPEFGRPHSPNRGYFYLWYNYSDHPTAGPGRPNSNIPTRDRLSRFTIPDGSSVADPKSELVLIDQYDRDLWHNGGGIFFGPDGFLYLSLGDEGVGNDVLGNAQRVDHSLFSGVIRIDVDQDPRRSHPILRQPANGKTAHYFIPDDNPWSGRADTLEEFYAIGLRNPHRMTLDPLTHAVLAADVGQDTWEEVDIIEKRGNYQWSYMEGFHNGPRPKPDKILGQEKPPIYEYGHTDGNNCVIGGYVYRGKQFPELFGKYIFGDNGSGRIWSMDGWAGLDPKPKIAELCRMPRQAYSGLTSFGVDRVGELYICQLGAEDGRIFKLAYRQTPTDVSDLPATLSKTGAFADASRLMTAPGLVPYTVNVPFWSDGAVKKRWIAVPAGLCIGFAPTGSFTFPAGTVFVKHFDLPVDDRNPTIAHRLETRLIVRDNKGGVYGASYKWRPDGSDADLMGQALTEEISINTAQPLGRFEAGEVGQPTRPSSFKLIDSPKPGFDIVTSGLDIGGNSDQFFLASQPRRGDFDLKARIESFISPDSHAKACLMARATRDVDSAFVLVAARAGNQPPPGGRGFDFQIRPAKGEAMRMSGPPGAYSYPNTWIRLRRIGNSFTAFSSVDGVEWTILGSQSVELPDTVLLGMAVTTRSAAASATAQFRDLAFVRSQSWYYPSPDDCLQCHNSTAGGVLGVSARQLNGDFTYPSHVVDNQLRAWIHAGIFDEKTTEADALAAPRLTAIDDPHATELEKVRGYLDANCAYCHRPGVAGGYFDARLGTPFTEQNILNGPVRNTFGIADAELIWPGHPERSILLRRLGSLAANEKMPPLARNARDPAGMSLLADWINSLSTEQK
jgi:glucose/arabinose dehydrogenase